MRVSPSSFLLERYLIMAKLGSIEAGGTKFICALSDEKLNIIAKKRISTTTPEDTMHSIFDFFRENSTGEFYPRQNKDGLIIIS